MFINSIQLILLLFPAIIISYLFSVLTDMSMHLWGVVFLAAIFSFFKIIFLNAMAISILELSVGEEVIFSLTKTCKNIRIYWPYIVLLYVMFLIGHFLLYQTVIFKQLALDVYFSHLSILIQYIWIRYVFYKKYMISRLERKRSSNRNIVNLIFVILVYSLYLKLFYTEKFLTNSSVVVNNFVGFIKEILWIWMAVLISLSFSKRFPEIWQRFNKKEIYLINPFGAGSLRSIGYSWLVKGYPPFFVVLKALTPSGYRFREFNQLNWFDWYYRPGKLVAITSYTSNCFEAYRIAKEFKKRGSTVVMGGPHVTYMQDEALAYCDSVVVGEAESIWPQVVKDYENNSLKKKYVAQTNLTDEGHHQVYEYLLQSTPEIIKDFLETSRGCKFKCHFCTVPALSNGKVRNQVTFELVELLKKVKQKFSTVTFIDNNIYNDPGYAKELFKALKPLNIRWRTACTIDIAKNDETLKLARDSGCEHLLIGYEVSDKTVDANLKGKFTMAQLYRQYTMKIKKMGIGIRANFIIGFENDRLINIFRQWQYCFSLSANSAGLSLLTPLPGAQLFYQMVTENRILNLNWRRYDMFHLVFKHPYISLRQMNLLFSPMSVFYLITASWTGRYVLMFFTAMFLIIYWIKL